MSETILEVNNIHKSYTTGKESFEALRGVSLSLEQGEMLAVMGSSGSGKSTLLHILGAMDAADEGEIRLNGELREDYGTEPAATRIRAEQIGFIFQGFNLIANLTAQENVELPLIYRGVPKKERHELSVAALKKVGLAHRMDHRPSEMSGGQQQRVAIARAIAQAPPVILADEPTGNLDSASSMEILDILKQLHAENRTVILITHDNDIAKQAKRVIRIKDGKIERDYENE